MTSKCLQNLCSISNYITSNKNILYSHINTIKKKRVGSDISLFDTTNIDNLNPNINIDTYMINFYNQECKDEYFQAINIVLCALHPFINNTTNTIRSKINIAKSYSDSLYNQNSYSPIKSCNNYLPSPVITSYIKSKLNIVKSYSDSLDDKNHISPITIPTTNIDNINMKYYIGSSCIPIDFRQNTYMLFNSNKTLKNLYNIFNFENNIIKTCSPVSFVCALIYIDRLLEADINFNITDSNIYYVYVSCFVIATKFIEIRCINTSYIAKAFDIDSKIINILLANTCKLLNFNFLIKKPLIDKYIQTHINTLNDYIDMHDLINNKINDNNTIIQIITPQTDTSLLNTSSLYTSINNTSSSNTPINNI